MRGPHEEEEEDDDDEEEEEDQCKPNSHHRCWNKSSPGSLFIDPLQGFISTGTCPVGRHRFEDPEACPNTSLGTSTPLISLTVAL
eukprot:8897686-Pyramimonas_sp.AAC.1